MNSIAIVRALLVQIQSESGPVYRAARQSALPNPAITGRWLSILFFTLLIIAAILPFAERQFGFQLVRYRNEAAAAALIAASGLFSLAWTVPLAALAGQGIARERVAQTWDMLRLTPMPTQTILLAKAAAAIRRVWGVASASALLAVCLGVVISGPVLFSRASGAGIWAVVLVIPAVLVVLIERAQEVALAVVVGIVVTLGNRDRRTSLWLGIVCGLLIRLLPLFAVLALLPSLALAEPALLDLPQAIAVGLWVAFCMIAGSAALLAALPGLPTLLVVAAFLLAREALVRVLLAWALRRSAEA